MPLLYGTDQAVADWVASQSGIQAPPVTAAIGWTQEGRIKAGVYFDSALPNTVFAHVASVAGVFPRQLLRAVCAYAFRQLGVERITFLVDTKNRQVMDFVTHLGAEHEGVMRNAFGATHGAWFAFWRDCAWAQRLLALQPSGGAR